MTDVAPDSEQLNRNFSSRTGLRLGCNLLRADSKKFAANSVPFDDFFYKLLGNYSHY